MKILLLAICLCITLLHTNAAVEFTNTKTAEYAARFRTASLTLQGIVASSPSTRFATADVSSTCNAATVLMVQKFLNCSAFSAASSLFQQQTGGPSQATINAYCAAPCKLAFNDAVTNFIASCTGLEIIALEYATRNDDEPFKFYSMLSGIRLPCVSLPDTSSTYGKEYCLQSFVSLYSAFAVADASGGVIGSDTLTSVCRPCLALFIAEYAKYAPPVSVKEFAYIDILCTSDAGRWCIVENREIDAMADGTSNTTAAIARATRICSTRCLQKILVKIVAAASIFNQTADDVIAARQYYAALNGLCAKNAAGEYCSVTARRFDDVAVQATAAGCGLGDIPSCSNASCAAYTNSFLASQGCCFKTLANTIIDATTGESELKNITVFASVLCGATIPTACARVDRGLVASIVITNIRWAYYLTAIAAFRAAVLLDIAASLGVRPEDITATFAQGVSTAANGFVTQATANSISVSVVIATDTTSQATSISSAYTTIMATQSLNLQSTSALTQSQYDARADASQPVGVSYSATSSSSSTGSNVSSAAHGIDVPHMIMAIVMMVAMAMSL